MIVVSVFYVTVSVVSLKLLALEVENGNLSALTVVLGSIPDQGGFCSVWPH